MPRLIEGTSLWQARMEARQRRKKPTHPTPQSVAERASVEERVALPKSQDTNPSNTSSTQTMGNGTTTWVRRTTRNVNEISADRVLTEEEQLEAALAESLAQDSAKPAEKRPVKQARKRQSKSKGLLTPQKVQKAVSKVPGQLNAPKLPKLRITNDRILVVREVDSLARSLDTDEPLDAFDFEQAEDLERQRQLFSLSMLERQEGYIHPAQGQQESAMRSTLAHDVDNDDFTAAFILREMANSDITADPESMDFVQRLMNPSASGRTLESTHSANKENPREEVIALRRSTRKKPAGAGNSSSKAIETEKPAPEPLRLDEGEGFMPSAANDFKFKYDSPSGLRAGELDALLKPPSRPKAFPADLAGQKTFLNKSLRVLGARPKNDAADKMVEEMELEHARTQQDVEMGMEQEDRWNELWGVEEWEE